MSGFANPPVFGSGGGFAPASAPAGPAFVQMAGATYVLSQTSPWAIQPAHNTTQGNTLLLVVKTSASITVTGVTDSKGNTWTVDETPGSTNANITLVRAALTAALTTGDTISIALSATSGNVCAQLLEFSGLAAAPLDQHTNANSLTLSVTVGPTGATTKASEIVVTAVARGGTAGATVWTPPSGYTEVPTGLGGAGDDLVDSAYKILTTTGTQTATWSATAGGANQPAVIATYKAA